AQAVVPLRKPLVYVAGAGHVGFFDGVLGDLTGLGIHGFDLPTVGSLAATHDGRFLIATQGASLAALATSTHQPMAATLALPEQPLSLAIEPRDRLVAAIGSGGVTLVDLQAWLGGAPGYTLLAMANIAAVAFAPDGQTVYALAGAPGCP